MSQFAFAPIAIAALLVSNASYAHEITFGDADTMLKQFNLVADLVGRIRQDEQGIIDDPSTAAAIHIDCLAKLESTTNKLMYDTLDLSTVLGISVEMKHPDDEAVVNKVIDMRVSQILENLTERRKDIKLVEAKCSDEGSILEHVDAYGRLEQTIRSRLEQVKLKSQPK